MIGCCWCWDDCKKKRAYYCSRDKKYICYKCIRKAVLKRRDPDWPRCCDLHNNLDYANLRKICSKKIKKLNKFVVKQDETYIMKSYNIKYCPKTRCGYAFAIGDNCDPDKLKCGNKKCKHKWCTVCMKKWKRGHKKVCQGVTDLQKMVSKLDDKKKATKKKPSKLCPHCSSLITKISGCPHMTCGWCSFEFCWNCLNNINQCECSYDDV